MSDVEMPTATSCARPTVSICRSKIASNPRSLLQAVSAEESVVSAIAAIGDRSVADHEFGGAAAVAKQQKRAAMAHAALQQFKRPAKGWLNVCAVDSNASRCSCANRAAASVGVVGVSHERSCSRTHGLTWPMFASVAYTGPVVR
jgi:hypothetical protein